MGYPLPFYTSNFNAIVCLVLARSSSGGVEIHYVSPVYVRCICTWWPGVGDAKKRVYSKLFKRGQHGFDTAVYTQTDLPGSAPTRERNLLSTITLYLIATVYFSSRVLSVKVFSDCRSTASEVSNDSAKFVCDYRCVHTLWVSSCSFEVNILVIFAYSKKFKCKREPDLVNDDYIKISRIVSKWFYDSETVANRYKLINF